MNPPHPTKRSISVSQEYDNWEPDRIALLAQANCFVNAMVRLQIAPMQMGAGVEPQAAELTPQERDTYSAALHLLKREFDAGPHDQLINLSKKEEEDLTEWPEPKSTSTSGGAS